MSQESNTIQENHIINVKNNDKGELDSEGKHLQNDNQSYY